MIIELLGVPLDLGASRRGVDMGPSAIRIAELSEKLHRIGHEVVDNGDLPIVTPEVQSIENPKLKYLPEITKAATRVAGAVRDILNRAHFPLVLGGDHSIAIGTVAGASAYLAESGRRLGLLWIDAHGDMNTPETTPSGNIHGMPLAVCLGKGAPELVQVAGAFAKVKPQDTVLVGARALDPLELELVRESGITIYTMEDIDRRGIFDVMVEAVEVATRYTDALHVSLDMDALDPQVAPGVGTPVRGGLTYREAHTAMEIIAKAGKLFSMDVVEVNPILDIRNATAEMAAELVLSALGKRIL